MKSIHIVGMLALFAFLSSVGIMYTGKLSRRALKGRAGYLKSTSGSNHAPSDKLFNDKKVDGIIPPPNTRLGKNITAKTFSFPTGK